MVWTVAFMFAAIAFLALVCDIGYATYSGARLQNAADAASLAGAQMVQRDPSLVGSQAIAIALANKAAGVSIQLTPNPSNLPAGDIVIGHFDQATRQFTPTTVSPNAVKVTARLTSSSANGSAHLIFGSALGVGEANLTRTSIATLGPRPDGNAGIIVLAPHVPAAMNITGNGNTTVVGGDIQVDSDDNAALTDGGYGAITANDVNIVGANNFTGYATIAGTLNTHVAYMPDPLLNLPAPQQGADLGAVRVAGKENVTISPGYYSGGITLTSNGSVTLLPGIYILGGLGISVTGNGSVHASGVMLYITGTGQVNLTGNGVTVMSPPNPTVNTFAGADTYEGITVFQARANARPGIIAGNGNMSIDGVLYAPAALLTLTGNGDTIGSQVISNTLRITGNGALLINRRDGHVHPLPQNVYLVQ
jgi:hypothetical protein